MIANGVLLEGGYLFWDEPEANLNPSSQRAVARALAQLVTNGTQVFVATHSMLFLRELQMIEAISPAYIDPQRIENDNAEEDDSEIDVQTSKSLDGLTYVASLEAEVEQAQRHLAR